MRFVVSLEALQINDEVLEYIKTMQRCPEAFFEVSEKYRRLADLFATLEEDEAAQKARLESSHWWNKAFRVDDEQ